MHEMDHDNGIPVELGDRGLFEMEERSRSELGGEGSC